LPLPLPIRPPQISHTLNQDLTRPYWVVKEKHQSKSYLKIQLVAISEHSISATKNQSVNAVQDNYTCQQDLTFFVPRTSVGELSSTFYAKFRYVCRIFLSGRISKLQRNLNVQSRTLTHETDRNFLSNVEVYDFRRYLALGTSLFSVQ
jgi:hypothetical protein